MGRSLRTAAPRYESVKLEDEALPLALRQRKSLVLHCRHQRAVVTATDRELSSRTKRKCRAGLPPTAVASAPTAVDDPHSLHSQSWARGETKHISDPKYSPTVVVSHIQTAVRRARLGGTHAP